MSSSSLRATALLALRTAPAAAVSLQYLSSRCGSSPEPGASAGGCPMHAASASSESAAASTSRCPVSHTGGGSAATLKRYVAPVQYDVYGRPIEEDPRNKMPLRPAQERAPGQVNELSTSRVASNIPKAGADATWTYPSPQMFWNALVRKGKAQGAREEDMATVVAVHNNMNELTWRAVLEWEKARGEWRATGADNKATTQAAAQGANTTEKSAEEEEELAHEPRLSRFRGRPDELSLEARLKVWLAGHPPPFDRHDWIVDRGGDERRYVVDFYSDDSRAHLDETPSALEDTDAVRSILVDVRPALDSPRAAFDRFVVMPWRRLNGDSPPGLPFFPSPAMRQAYRDSVARVRAGAEAKREEDGATATTKAAASSVSSSSSSYSGEAATKTTRRGGATAVAAENRDAVNAAVAKKCGDRFIALRDCGDDEKRCADAAIALQHCVASLVCPSEALAFQRACADAGDKDRAEATYAEMDACLARFAGAGAKS